MTPGAWSLGSWWFHLPDSEGWGVDLCLFCFYPMPTAAFPAGQSWVWVPDCWVSGEGVWDPWGSACVWQVSLFLRSYFVLKSKYKPPRQVKTETAEEGRRLYSAFEQRAWHFYFALGPTNHIASPSENCFIAQPLTKKPRHEDEDLSGSRKLWLKHRGVFVCRRYKWFPLMPEKSS